ncbi:MAG: hypothetical protein AAF901_11355 [Bacteroidota bacterium]
MSNTDSISLNNEITYINAYIDLEKMRLGDNFSVVMNIDEQLKTMSTRIPTMLFQPVIENAIIHGLQPKTKDRVLKIIMLLEDDMLIGVVEDNGIGRAAAKQLKAQNPLQYRSWSMHILKARIKAINSIINEYDMSIKFIDLMDHGKPLGTRVILTIPIKHIMFSSVNGTIDKLQDL